MADTAGRALPGLELTDSYRVLRDTDPVRRDSLTGAWTVYRHDDAAAVLADHRSFASDFTSLFPESSSENGGVGTMDPPLHHQVRAIVSQAFTPRAIAEMEARVQRLAGQLVDGVAGRPSVELIGEVAYPLPVTVIAELLGVPPEDRDLFRRWADALLATGPGGDEEATAARSAAAIAVFRDYVRDHVAARRAHPRDDLLSHLASARVGGRTLDAEQITGFATELLLAGQLTTTTLIGSAVLCLDEEPAAQAELRANPAAIPAAIEEVMRYRSPVVSQDRLATTEVELRGRRIQPLQVVKVCLLSANHDERCFERPGRFLPGRDPNPHLGFGKGIHFCLGAPLARLESRAALSELLRRFSRIRVDPARPVEYASEDLTGSAVGSTSVRALSRVHLLLDRA